MYDSDDQPTRPYPALSPEPTKVAIRLPEYMTSVAIRLPEYMTNASHGVALEDLTVEDLEPPTRVLSTLLPASARDAFALFCDSERIHEWMPIVRSSQVISRTPCGRAKRTAFIARLERSSMGYTMHYEYDDPALTVRWNNGPDATTRITGTAQFTRVGRTSCMMHYELDMESDASLPAWGDPMYNGHPASSVVSDFRDFLSRNWG